MKNFYIDIAWRGKWKLTENQYTRMVEISNDLHTLLNEVDQFTLLQLNIDEFFRYMKKFQKNNNHDFVNLNRYFTNYINSFYMWISFHEKYYKTIFSELKPSFYDNNFSYRIAYNIRIYTAHESMPITLISTDIINETVTAQISVSELINTSCNIQSRFRNELKEKYKTLKNIDVLWLSQELKAALLNCQKTIWNKLQPKITSWLIDINNIFPVADPAIINAYIETDHDERPIPLGHQLKYLNDKSIREKYDFFKGYKNHILQISSQ